MVVEEAAEDTGAEEEDVRLFSLFFPLTLQTEARARTQVVAEEDGRDVTDLLHCVACSLAFASVSDRFVHLCHTLMSS